jgi:hypothetical protein
MENPTPLPPRPLNTIDTPVQQRLKKLLVTLSFAFVLGWGRAILDPRARAAGVIFDFGLLATFVLNAFIAQSPRQIRQTAALAIVLLGVQFAVFRALPHDFIPALAIVARMLGLASLLMMLLVGLRARDEALEPAMRLLLIGLLPTFFIVLAMFGAYLSILFHLVVWDGLLYAWEGTLGFQASFAIGRLFRAWPLLASLCQLVYLLAPVGLALVYGTQRRSRPPVVIDVGAALIVTTIIGFGLYQLFPATGPGYIFHDAYPLHPPLYSTVTWRQPFPMPAPRNCVPSLHTAWALLLVWHSRGRATWLRVTTGAFLVLTLLATMGLGEHYLPDLVIAVPFTAATQAMVAPPSPARWPVLLAGAGVTALWLVLLATGVLVRHPSALGSGALTLATVALGVMLSRRLWRASAAVADAAFATAAPEPC